jgi:hypothetical protein
MDSKTRLGSAEPTGWERLATLLLHWAHYVMRGVRIRGSLVCVTEHGLPAIRGCSAEDFVYGVIGKAIGADVEPNDSALQSLKDQVKQSIYQNARRKENHVIHPDSIEELSVNGSAKIPADNCITPSEAMIEAEETRRLVEFIKTSNDEELIHYAQCIFEGVKKPKEFAAAMSISVERANYLKKKLRKFFAGYDRDCLDKSQLQFVIPLTRSI